MYKGDIANEYRSRIAVMFEGLLMSKRIEPENDRRKWWQRKPKDEPEFDDAWMEREVRSWQVNDLPLKSVIHMMSKLGQAVDVYTYYDPIFKPHIEHWLARKGAHCNVYCYEDVDHLIEDLRYDRSVGSFYTSYEEDAARIGWHRATVVPPDRQFGF